MSDYLLNTAQASAASQLPLLFFVKNRRPMICFISVGVIILGLPIAFFSSGIPDAINRRWWSAVALFASIDIVLGCGLICSLLRAYQMIRPGPVLIIYEQGIHDRRLGKRIIPWGDISILWQKVFLFEHLMVCFEVAKTAEIRRNMSLLRRLACFLNRQFGFGSFCVDFSHLNGDAEVAITCIVAQVKGANPDVIIRKTDRGPLERLQ